MNAASNYQSNSPYNEMVLKLQEIFNCKIDKFYVMKKLIGITFNVNGNNVIFGIGGNKTDVFFNQYSDLHEIDFVKKQIRITTDKNRLSLFFENVVNKSSKSLPAWDGEINLM